MVIANNHSRKRRASKKALFEERIEHMIADDLDFMLCDYSGTDIMEKEELKLVIEATAKKASKETMDEFMRAYGLTAAHWVWVDQEYKKTMGQQSLIRKTIIVTLITAAAAFMSFAMEMRLKEFVLTILKSGSGN